MRCTLKCVTVKRLTETDIIAMLRKLQGDMTQRELAEKIGVSQQYLCDVLIGRRDPGPSILQYLGIEKAYISSETKA
jgi:transcriptional regulator with XRE-family HTH domain